MDAVEVSNHVLKVLDIVLKDSPRFTGKIEIEINCNSGGIGSVTAQEKRRIDMR
jgi:hypothetical protein